MAALGPVPVIGEIAEALDAAVLEPAAGIMTDISSTVSELVGPAGPVADVQKILDELKSGLVKVSAVITDVTVTAPQYLNTVQILCYLLDVAQPLSEILKGSDAAENLKKITTDLMKTKNAVGSAVLPVANDVKAIANAAAAFADDIKKIYASMGYGVTTAITHLKSAGAALSPITNGFEKATHAIAPIRWAWDAISCIVYKVLTPVIHWILKVTGLRQMVDEAKEKVIDWLGIGPLLTGVQEVNGKDVSKGSTPLQESSGASAVVAFGDFAASLEDYKTNNKGSALQAGVDGLMTAIIGEPIDVIKAGPMPPPPPKPSVPTLDGVTGSDTALASMNCLIARPIAAPGFAARLSAIHSATTLARISPALSLCLIASDNEAGPDLPAIDSLSWPQSAASVTAVQEASNGVQALSGAMQQLQASLDAFSASLDIPDQFAQQTDALNTAFKTCDDAVTIIHDLGITFVDPILVPVDTALKTQIKDAAQIASGTPQLQNAVKRLEAAVQVVIDKMPDARVVDAAVHQMDGWLLGAQQLVASVDLAPATRDTVTLNAQIDANAKAVADRVSAIATNEASLTKSVAAMQAVLDSYSAALQAVTQHSDTISTKSMPSLQHTASLLGKIDSIFDPLSALITELQQQTPVARATDDARTGSGVCADATKKMR